MNSQRVHAVAKGHEAAEEPLKRVLPRKRLRRMYWAGLCKTARESFRKLALIFVNDCFEKIAWLKRLRAPPARVHTG